MAKKLNIGVVGLGFMGKHHINVYSSNPKAQIVAVMDIDKSKLEGDLSSVGGNIGDLEGKSTDLSKIAKYDKLEDLIADPNVDVVDITLPTFLHADAVVLALEAGKHVLCEKPMALDLKQCDRMLAAAKKAKGRFMIAHCIRFWPEYVAAYDALKNKKYGKILSAEFRRSGSTPGWSWNGWLMKGDKSGSAILDLHIHDVDFINHLFGKPLSVNARGTKGVVSEGGFDRVFTQYEVKSGNVGINIGIVAPMAFYPFSGMSGSFLGILHSQGKEAVRFFTESKVCIHRWL